MNPFTVDYIEDAATKRVNYLRRGKTYEASNYDTPENGIHLCGQHVNETEPTTVAAYRLSSDLAVRLFDVARDIACVEKDAGDFVVDLCLDGDIVDDFYSNRQLWPLAIAAWNAALGLPVPSEAERVGGAE